MKFIDGLNQYTAIADLGGGKWRVGAGKSSHMIVDPTFEKVNALMGRSSTLEIKVNGLDDEDVCTYTFTKAEFKKDAFLRALVFGRTTTKGSFTATNAIRAHLILNYSANISLHESVNNYDFAANCGIQAEDNTVNSGAKKTTKLMDKRYKVDYVKNHRNIQCKCSIKHKGTSEHDTKSYSYSKTNGETMK